MTDIHLMYCFDADLSFSILKPKFRHVTQKDQLDNEQLTLTIATQAKVETHHFFSSHSSIKKLKKEKQNCQRIKIKIINNSCSSSSFLIWKFMFFFFITFKLQALATLPIFSGNSMKNPILKFL